MDSSAGSGQNVYPQGQAFRGVAENRQGREEGGDRMGWKEREGNGTKRSTDSQAVSSSII